MSLHHSIIYRPAQRVDAPIAIGILRDWINETPWMPMIHSRRSMEAFWTPRLEQSESWVGEHREKVIGFCTRVENLITALYIARDFRRAGIGTHFLNLAKQERSELGLWTFEANKAAIAFYRRSGFKAVGQTRGDNEEGLPDVYLEWKRSTQ